MNTPYVFRKCTKCGEWLVANNYNFGKNKNGKFGLKSQCKVCNKEYHKEYVENNKEKLREYNKEYYENNKEKLRECHKEYRENHKEYHKEYYKENKEKFREYNKEYKEKNKDKIKEYHKEYNKEYKEKNKDKIKEHNKEYNKEYYEDNKEYYKKYYEDNKERINEHKKQYYEDNKERINEHKKQYRASERGKLISFNNRTKRRTLIDKQGKGITKEQWLEMMKFFDWKCGYSGEILGTKTRTIDHIAPLAQGGAHEIWNLVPMTLDYNRSKNSKLTVLNWYKKQEYFSEERLAKIVEWQQYAYDKWATEDDDPPILITDLYTGDDDIWLEK